MLSGQPRNHFLDHSRHDAAPAPLQLHKGLPLGGFAHPVLMPPDLGWIEIYGWWDRLEKTYGDSMLVTVNDQTLSAVIRLE